MDERVPVKLRKESGEFVLNINADTEVKMSYCAWCGESLHGGQKPNSLGAGVCKHVEDLAAKPGSSLKYQGCWMLGAGDLSVRLFFCPTCGRELPVDEERRWEKSPSEIAMLTTMFANIKSIGQAIEQVGPPDFQRGPYEDHFYWKGKRSYIGYRKSLIYERLAKTVDVHVVDWVGGELTVKFLAKPLGQGPIGQKQAKNKD